MACIARLNREKVSQGLYIHSMQPLLKSKIHILLFIEVLLINLWLKFPVVLLS